MAVVVSFRCRQEGRVALRRVRVPEGTPLLEAARRAGLPVARACGGEGLCGRCGLRVLEGAEALSPEAAPEAEARRRNRGGEGLRLACQACARGPVTATATYWQAAGVEGGPEAAEERRAVVLVDHGSREPEANALLEAVAERLRTRLPGRTVRVAHMELASPGLDEAVEACVAQGAREILVHPYFLGPGRHASRDIPRMAAEAEARHPGVRVRVTPPLGLHDGIVDAVLARLSEAGGSSRTG